MSLRIGMLGASGLDTFETNVVAAARRLGHDADVLGSMGGSMDSRWRQRAFALTTQIPSVSAKLQRDLVGRIPYGFDLLIVNTSHAPILYPSTVEALRERSRRTVCWYVDAVSNLGAAHFLDAPYDGIFMTDRHVVSRLSSVSSIPVHLLPEGHDSVYHRPVHVPERARHVAVVGTLHSARRALLRRLKADGIPLAYFGTGLPSGARPIAGDPRGPVRFVTNEEKSRVFGEASAVLNNLHPAEIDKVNCRVFEATAAGGVVVSEWRPLLDELFTVGQELFAYRTYDELLSTLRQCLAFPCATEDMRRRAAARAARDHSLDRRIQELVRLSDV
jgi:spore maturation protein CgeB